MPVIGVPPEITPENRAFWEGTARGELVIERCVNCGRNCFPPRGMCPACRNRTFELVTLEGPGTIYSYTVNHQKWAPDMEVPYGLADVEFASYGVCIRGRLRDFDLSALEIGQLVAIGVEEGPAGCWVPSFTPWTG
jgi:uncharacterized OB-fold protein